MASEIDIEMLIDALSDPAAYPHAPASIETLQTHGAALFFVGDLVYKVKKPVNYGFLDFSTPERRLRFCREEVRLNRRLAPDVYLGVVPVMRDATGRVQINGAGEIVEHAVEMRRLPADRMLDALLQCEALRETDLDAIADRIAAFHATARSDDEVRAYGSTEAVEQRIATNLDECDELAGDLPSQVELDAPTVSRRTMDRLRAWNDAELSARRAVIADRANSGRIVEGHGDLHAGNICMLESAGVVAYDCIEFEPAFRCLDVAAELAFLAMDLEQRGCVEAAAHLCHRYAHAADDAGLHALQPLYRCHYACVRAKVAALRARNLAVPQRARELAWRESVSYFHLALGYTLPPTLVAMCGLPGSGKSWWAQRLAKPLRATVVRSDAVRKELAGMQPSEHPAEENMRIELYSESMIKKTYFTVAARARAAIKGRRSAIVDTTAPTAAHRAQVLSSAGDGVGVIALCTCPDDVTRTRLAARERAGTDISDAGVGVYLDVRERFEAPRADDPNVEALGCQESDWVGIERILGRVTETASGTF